MSEIFFATHSVRGQGAAGTLVGSSGTLPATAGTAVFGWAGPDTLGGGVTIGSAVLINNAAGTCGAFYLIALSSVGANAGTLGSVTGAYAKDTPLAFTISDSWLDGGEYLGVELGTANGVGQMNIHVFGKYGK